jgi:hypothetical protein
MSTAAISSHHLSQQLQQYFETRQSDLQQLGQALKSGDLAGAQAAYNKIETLGQNGPFGGNPFKITQREQDFNTIGQALQSGDVAGAKQAFDALRDTFTNPPPASVDGSGGVSGLNSSAGPEIILNLSNSNGGSSPEQVTINLSNPANSAGEQGSFSVGNQGSSAQEITFNLNPNSNEQIVVNLLDGSSSTSSSSGASANGGLSVSA